MKTPTKSEAAEPRIREHSHGLLDATTIAGAVAGATAGLVAGPAGLLLGGAIGTAVGTVAGAFLEEEANYREDHERELDEAVGITGHDLGAREVAAAGVNRMEEEERARERRSWDELRAFEASFDPPPPVENEAVRTS
jgi:uncharacterized protein YcfJ